MSKLLLILLFVLLYFTNSFSQSQTELDKKYSIYKKNKVRTETIEYSDNSKTISQFDKKGRPTEIMSYNNGVESYVTNYKYDKKGYLSEESYFGYESGDGVTTQFYYDDKGNMIKSTSTGNEEGITEYINDEQGNPTKITYYTTDNDKTNTGIINYKNTYDNGLLTGIEAICNDGDDYTICTKFTYDGENLILNEDFDKDCKTGALKFSMKKSFKYSADNLISETEFESTYSTGIIKGVYSYEKY